MGADAITFSDDQARAWDRIAAVLGAQGIDVDDGLLTPATGDESALLAVIGKAGSGKTLLLAELCRALIAAGIEIVSGDYEAPRSHRRRRLAILAPTNKAASVLRARGVPATTLHRIIYSPVYDPEYERIAEWLQGRRPRPAPEGIDDALLDRIQALYERISSVTGALAAAGIRGADFITGWKRREDPLDLGLVDEASMLSGDQLDDLRALFPRLILFGDPAQLPPVGESEGMVFDHLAADQKLILDQVHRQAGDNPILDLALALGDPKLEFADFEALVRDAAQRDDRVTWAESVDADLMARSPVLVWRNVTRIKLITAFRRAHEAPDDALIPGEPLICDGIELPARHRRRRIDLEARGLIKGAQAIYLGPGRRSGFARLHVIGAEEPNLSVASIIRIERPDDEEPFIPVAAGMGATFLHGAAVTVHKAQGSQWPTVQVFAPDLWIAAKTGRTEAGLPLWKRLAYVAITRAEERLRWVVRNRISRPRVALGTADVAGKAPELRLATPPGADDAAHSAN